METLKTIIVSKVLHFFNIIFTFSASMFCGILASYQNCFMRSITDYQNIFSEYLSEIKTEKAPENLYAPVNYILDLGGKRLRPVLTLMIAEAFGGEVTHATAAAAAIEYFHNFSLIHDDIMDAAPLRRGAPTVHKKWDTNTGILSGDAMLVMAYSFLNTYEPEMFKKLTALFSETALQVCEGQQLDMDFERRKQVTEDEYIHMITYKTAVLVACAMKMGACVANTTKENAQAVYDFGLNLGLAFQLQDDYLDTFGDTKTFGKQAGGDIIENKKTFLYIKSLELGTDSQQKQLIDWFTVQPKEVEKKIESVKEIYCQTKADLYTRKAIKTYTQRAFGFLDGIQMSTRAKEQLKVFGEALMNRTI